ncbi:MAG: hypothetical protein LW875_03680 [Proteobacteria bacterium]|nr:hypothetical protein [Pseudomonadota bacterium]
MRSKMWMATLALICSFNFPSRATEISKPITWQYVHDFREFLVASAQRLSSDSQNADLGIKGRREIIHPDAKQAWGKHLADFNSVFAVHSDRLLKTDFRLARTNSEESLQMAVLKVAYVKSVLDVAGSFFSTSSFSSFLQSEGKNSQVITFLELLSLIEAQVIDTRAEADPAIRLSNIRNPTAITLAYRTEELTRLIQKRIKDSKIRRFVASSLSEDLQFILDGRNSFLRSARKHEITYGALYEAREALLSLASRFAVPKDFAISREQVESIESQLEPGDIGLIRHDLKLTNIGINSNWSHSVLYVGAPQKLYGFFDQDQETNSYFRGLCQQEGLNCSSFSGFLRTRFPQEVAKYENGNHQTPYVSIESLRPGVILSDLYSSLQKDRLAVLRPNLSKKDRALAVAAAFGYLGRPYDYRFDLAADDRLICSELIFFVYRAQRSQEKNGLEFPVAYLGMTPLFKPKDIVQFFFSTEDAGRPALSLVALAGKLEGLNQESPLMVFRRTLELK